MMNQVDGLVNMPTSSIQDINKLLNWLRENNGDIPSNNIEIKYSSGKGLGVFAVKDFDVGEVVFSIPRTCIIGIDNALASNSVQVAIAAAELLNVNNVITVELLIWLFMCEQQHNAFSHFFPYLTTLDNNDLPTPLVWDHQLLKALDGSNIESALKKSFERIQIYCDFFDTVRHALENRYQELESIVLRANDVLNRDHNKKRFRTTEKLSFNESVFNRHSILWARSHYLSRRYPGKLALISKHRNVNKFKREEGMGLNYGAMCPLLDLLNHNSSNNWLNLVEEDELLKVVCNVRIQLGDEIFYNYGYLSNEMLLYGYGYAEENNEHDSVAIQAMIMSTGSPQCLGTYYIKSGGFDGIPKELWSTLKSSLFDEITEDASMHDVKAVDSLEIEVGIEECEVMRDWLKMKVEKLQASATVADNIIQNYLNDGDLLKQDNSPLHAKFVKIYRENQFNILQETIDAINSVIDQAEID